MREREAQGHAAAAQPPAQVDGYNSDDERGYGQSIMYQVRVLVLSYPVT